MWINCDGSTDVLRDVCPFTDDASLTHALFGRKEGPSLSFVQEDRTGLITEGGTGLKIDSEGRYG